MTKSFSLARKSFGSNLKTLINSVGYTTTDFALKLTATLSNNSITSATVYDWISNKSFPNPYQLFKIADFFNVKMDDLVNPTFDINNTNTKSFAKQQSNTMFQQAVSTFSNDITAVNPIDSTVTSVSPITTTPIMETINMTTKKNNPSTKLALSKSTVSAYQAEVKKHSTSTTANAALVFHVYNRLRAKNMPMKALVNKVGASTRALRNYVLYGVSIPAPIAKNLVKELNVTYTNLGLVYNEKTDRYDHCKLTAIKNITNSTTATSVK